MKNLADLLKAFKKDKHNELMDELKDNANLTKDKLSKLLKIELENNDFLSKEQKENVDKFLNVNNGFCVEIVGSKFKEINDFLGKAKELRMDEKSIKRKLDDFTFSAKDVQIFTAQSSKDSMQNIQDAAKMQMFKIILPLLLSLEIFASQSSDIANALKKASLQSGIDKRVLYTIAKIESEFEPHIIAFASQKKFNTAQTNIDIRNIPYKNEYLIQVRADKAST